MLSSANRDLISRDPSLPGLALIFDHQRVLATIAPHCALSLAEGRMTNVRYKPGTTCLVSHTFATDGGVMSLYAKAFAGNPVDKMAKKRRQCTVVGPLGFSSLVIESMDVLLHAFPNDGYLRSLHLVTSADARQTLFARCLPDAPDLWTSAVSPLRYKPERRYVARLQEGDRQALFKLHTADFANANEAAKQIHATDRLSVARRLGWSTEDRAVIVEWLEGDSLDSFLRDGVPVAAALQRVGQALHDLHRQPALSLNYYPLTVEIEAITAAVAAISATCPPLATRVAAIAEAICGRLAIVKAPLATIHGDFSADQVLLQANGRVALLDFDCAGIGDPMADLGSFAATLQHDVALGLLPLSTAENAIAALIEGYAATVKNTVKNTGESMGENMFNAERFRWHCLGRLLRLVISPFRTCEPDWPLQMEAIVERLERLWKQQ